jgi:SOS response regulatory protein OraA/RecX
LSSKPADDPTTCLPAEGRPKDRAAKRVGCRRQPKAGGWDALALATRYAGLGVRSIQELRTYLRRRGVAERAIARTIAVCRDRGVVDDAACARLWAEHWARQGYAWAAIRLRLSAKGLTDDAIRVAERTTGRAPDDVARARAVVAQRAARRAGPRERVRLARVLASRGFDADVIDRILTESLGPIPSDAEP